MSSAKICTHVTSTRHPSVSTSLVWQIQSVLGRIAKTDNSLGMTKIGTIRMDFTNVDMSTFRTRTQSTGTEYRLEYEICVNFRADEGVLRCFCRANGRAIGVTTFSFADLVG